ncbi:MAG: thiol reductase thioredoxin [Proteobacteria bacterium]|nr:thiol reductase thioredoxin [Pseudomonadota bacterium]
MSTNLYDTRQNFWREQFSTGLPYAEFLAASPAPHQERWRSFEKRLEIPAKIRETAQSFIRTMHLGMLVGSWCGDCARQGPMLAALADLNPRLHLRFFDNARHAAMADELRIHGASRVPVLLIVSEDFFEVARFGDRTLSAYRTKAAVEVGATCDAGLTPSSTADLAQEITEWFEVIERAQLLLRTSGLLRARYRD